MIPFLLRTIARELSGEGLPYKYLVDHFSVAYTEDNLGDATIADIEAHLKTDPAATCTEMVVEFYKGLHALTAHRVAYYDYKEGNTRAAHQLAYRCSLIYGVDIHPAASFGSGVAIDHGTGLVVGETAVVGNDVSLFHAVTLGGTGKDGGVRHPVIEDGCMIGAGSILLGRIIIGAGSKIGAGSVVTCDVPPKSVVTGVRGFNIKEA